MSSNNPERMQQNLNDSRKTDTVKSWIAVCNATCKIRIKTLGNPTALFELQQTKYFNLPNTNAYRVSKTPGGNVYLVDYKVFTVPQIDIRYMRGKLDFGIGNYMVTTFIEEAHKKYIRDQTIYGIVISKFQNINGWNNHGYLIPLQPR